MSFAIIADVHANLEALTAVLADIRQRGADRIFCLGDIVGYGPDPGACVEMVRDACDVVIAGNHDRAAAGLSDAENFNPRARLAMKWTRDRLDNEHKLLLAGLPLLAGIEGDLLLVHGSPDRPEQWNYILGEAHAEEAFAACANHFCFVGHSHRPWIYSLDGRGTLSRYDRHAELGPGNRYLVNAGSVGQPRDGDLRACYAMVDDSTIRLVRVPYPVEKTQRKIAVAGLPIFLAERLALGV